MGSGWKYRWSSSQCPPLSSCCAAQFLPPQAGSGPWPRGWGPLMYGIYLAYLTTTHRASRCVAIIYCPHLADFFIGIIVGRDY